MPAQYTVEQVADAIIHLCRERNIEITNLKLQKLLYYAQVWHLVFSDEPLFDAELEAWVHGPVVPRVFRRFKEYRWNAITAPVDPAPDEKLIAYLGEVLNTYGCLSGSQLERLTHREGPWRDARAGVAADESSNEVITHESIKRYYKALAGR
ncbi:MAG: type II toxin-antitoxin system antitoxin SocA domain-containing protein [Acidobacteriaceae bacterium]